jgi:hypothetical protein
VSQTPFASNDLTTILADPNVESIYVTGAAGRPTVLSGALLGGVAVQGQYVRVQLSEVAPAYPSIISPMSLSPKIWLDGKDIDGDGLTNDNPANNATVTSWTDKSGNGNDPTLQNAVYRASSPIQ